MKKKDAWVALFGQKPMKEKDLEQAFSVIAGDKEPDADVDAALDDVTRERIQDFLMDPNAFIQANASDGRKASFWVRLVPVPTAAPAAKPKAAPKAKLVPALPAKPVSASAPASVVLPPPKAGLNPNALAAAARALTAPVAAPTLSLGNVSAPVVASYVGGSTPVVQPASAPAANPATVPVSSTQPSASPPPTIIVAGTPSAPPQSTDPIALTEQAITELMKQGKEPTALVQAQWRREAKKVSRAKALLEFEAAERQRQVDKQAAEQQRILDEDAAERKRMRDEQAAERKRVKDEEAADRRRAKDEEDRKRQQRENVPKEEVERLAALVRARQIPPVTVRILADPMYVVFSDRYIVLFADLRSADSLRQAKAHEALRTGHVLLRTWANGASGLDRANLARHVMQMIDELLKRRDVTDPHWFHNNFISGSWEAEHPRTAPLR